MLDRLIAFTRRQPDIICGDIILEIDKGIWTGPFGMTIRNFPCRKRCPALFRHGDAGAVCHGVLKASRTCRTRAATDAFFDGAGQIKSAVARPGVNTCLMRG